MGDFRSLPFPSTNRLVWDQHLSHSVQHQEEENVTIPLYVDIFTEVLRLIRQHNSSGS